MTPIFAAKLSGITQRTDVGVQKIDCSPIVIYEIVLIGFSVQNKLKKVQFFEKTFLLTDISIEVIRKMSFLILLDINM